MNRRTMGTNITTLAAAFALVMMGDASAQTCPPEVAQAKAALERVAGGTEQQLPRTAAGAKQEIQSPRGQEIQSPRGQEIQSPRGEEIQSPRGQEIQSPRQEIQSPRGQEIQSPRGQEIQSPRGQEAQSPRTMAGAQGAGASDKAAALVKDAEAACSVGDMALAAQKAKAALEVLK